MSRILEHKHVEVYLERQLFIALQWRPCTVEWSYNNHVQVNLFFFAIDGSKTKYCII